MRKYLLIVSAFLLTACVQETSEHVVMPQYAMTSASYAEYRLHNYREFHIQGREFNGNEETNATRKLAYGIAYDWFKQKLTERGLSEASSASEGVLSIRYGLVSEDELSDDKIVQLIGITPGLVSPNNDKLSMGVSVFDGEMLLWRGVIQGIPSEHISDSERKKRFEGALFELTQSAIK